MYVPKKWQMSCNEKITNFINEYGFATLINNNLEASHLPLLLKADEGEMGVLYGHFSRANSQWKDVDGTQVLAVFNGPHSYISPSWYASKPAVPTWNYASVHVKGELSLLDNQQTDELVMEMVKQYEPTMDTESMIPGQFKQKMLNGIVGFKMVISQLQGKEKLGQHRNEEDQQGVVSGLENSTHSDAKPLLDYMNKHQIGLG